MSLVGPTYFLVHVLLFTHAASFAAAPVLQSLKKETQIFHQTEDEKRTILSQLYDLNANISKIQREQDGFHQRRTKVETDVANLTQVVVHLNKKIDEQKTRLARRLRLLNQFGGQGALQLAFSTQSSSSLDREMRTLKKIVGLDFQAFVTYRTELHDLQTQQRKLREKQIRLATLIEEMSLRSRLISDNAMEKNRLLGQIDSKQLLRVTKMKRLRVEASGQLKQDESSMKLARKLANLETLLEPSFVESRGLLVKPFSGKLVARFGIVPADDRDSEIKIRSHGVAWQTIATSPVTNVYSGSVIFQGDVSGFGPTVVVDHGEHYYSVYAHLDQVNVSPGQHLNAGESLGVSQKLYFEIRHYSESEDPQAWLRR